MMLTALTLCLLPFLVNGGVIPEKAFYETGKGEDIIYGDIMLSERDKFIRQLPKDVRMSLFIKDNKFNRWPNNVVPYVIASQYSKEQRTFIQKTLKILEQNTCFRFPEKTSQHQDYISFESKDGCYSNYGRQGGKQVVSLNAASCVRERTVLHETMHAIGIAHEHQRSDRDKYIDVHMENVEAKQGYNFDILSDSEFETAGFAYDIKSIMHYFGEAFGKRVNTNPESYAITMTLKGTNTPVPYNDKLTSEDIKKIMHIGNCPTNNKSTFTKTTNSRKNPHSNKNKKRRGRAYRG